MNDASDGSARQVAIGIDLGGHGLKAVLVDQTAQVLVERVQPLTKEERSQSKVEKHIAELVGTLRDQHSGTDVVPVGVGIPGFLEGEAGLLRSSPNFPGWENLPVGKRLSALLGHSVTVENDANCALLGESWAGAAAGRENVLLVTLGTGVGTAALVRGQLLSGARGLSPEGGHIPLYAGGRRCGCGLRGCLEAYASGPGLLTTAEEAWFEEGRSEPLDAKSALDVFAAETAAGGPEAEHWASRAIERYCLDLAQGIASMVHLLAPDMILLAGGMSGAFSRIGPPIQTALKKRCVPAFYEPQLTVARAALGDFSGAVGAARLALQSD
jgi:glucokinase